MKGLKEVWRALLFSWVIALAWQNTMAQWNTELCNFWWEKKELTLKMSNEVFNSINISKIINEEFDKFKKWEWKEIIKFYGGKTNLENKIKDGINSISTGSIDVWKIKNILEKIRKNLDKYYCKMETFSCEYGIEVSFKDPNKKSITKLVRDVMWNNKEEWQINLISHEIIQSLPWVVSQYNFDNIEFDYDQLSVWIRDNIVLKWDCNAIWSQVVKWKIEKISLEIVNVIKKNPGDYWYFLPNWNYVMNNDKLQNLVSEKIKKEFKEYFKSRVSNNKPSGLEKMIMIIFWLLSEVCWVFLSVIKKNAL